MVAPRGCCLYTRHYFRNFWAVSIVTCYLYMRVSSITASTTAVYAPDTPATIAYQHRLHRHTTRPLALLLTLIGQHTYTVKQTPAIHHSAPLCLSTRCTFPRWIGHTPRGQES